MDQMAEEICLDTDVSIAILRNEPRAERLTEVIGTRQVCTTPITVFELMLRTSNLEKVAKFLDGIKILSLDNDAALKASEISKQLKKDGKILEFRDIFIASITVTNHCRLATFNLKDFEKIKSLEILRLA